MTWVWRGLASVVIVSLAIFALWQVPQAMQNPVGCDPFGYQRQAQLFRTNGLAGIDTDLAMTPGATLLDVARTSGFPPRQWFEAVAPHCHHYVAASGKVVLQYSSGTGWLMSLFPAPIEERVLLIVSIAAIAIAFTALVGTSSPFVPLVSTSVVGGAIVWATAAQVGSDSLSPAVAFSVAVGVLTTLLFRKNSIWIALLIGLLIGLSASIRLSNIFLCLGIFGVLAVLLFRDRRPGWFWLGAALAAGLIVGAIPLLAANAINAGSIFRTTYAPGDASLPKFTVEQLTGATAFYFQPNPGGLLLMLSLGVLAFELVRRHLGAASVAAAVTLVFCVLYFLTKDIVIGYYLIPTEAFYLSAVVTGWISSTTSEGPKLKQVGIIAAAASLTALAIAGVFTHLPYVMRDDKVDPLVAASLAAHPMVWANVHGGYFITFNNVYSAKLVFGGPEVQDALLNGLADHNVPQLIVDDGDDMQKIIARISSGWHLTLLGKAYDLDVYAINRLSPPA
jgi:hypothetical protein